MMTTNKKYCSINCSGGKWRTTTRGFQPDLLHSVRSGWEYAFSKFLKENKVQYKYEPDTFDLGFFSYLPDFYLPDTDMWIEIKGIFDKKSIKKIKEFRKLGHKLLVLDETYFTKTSQIKNKVKLKKILYLI